MSDFSRLMELALAANATKAAEAMGVPEPPPPEKPAPESKKPAETSASTPQRK